MKLLSSLDQHSWITIFQTIVFPASLWFGKRVLEKASAALDAKIALAAEQRIAASRAKIMEHIDEAFRKHEACDRDIIERLHKIERGMERGSERFARLEARLDKRNEAAR